jgi:hypothetical protein
MSESIDTIRILADQLAGLHDDENIANKWKDEFHEQLDELEAKYGDLKAQAQSDADAKRAMEAVAKGIPALSKGIISAVQGFQKNDPFAGAAGVIDAVSAVITTAATISGAAGPPGAIVGAILSVVSMIVKLFSAQKPARSLEEKLEEMIRNLNGETKLQLLATVRKDSLGYVKAISPSDYGKKSYAFAKDDIDHNIPEAKQRIEDAAGWLNEKNNKELDLWSLVLASQCLAYIAYTQALVIALNLIEKPEEREKFRNIYFHTLTSNQSDFLQEILPAVRNRGTVWLADYWGKLYNRTVVVSAKKRDWIKCGATKGGDYAWIQSLTVVSRPSHAVALDHPNLAQFGTETETHDRYIILGKDTPFSKHALPNYDFRGRFGQAPFSDYYGVALKPDWPNLTPAYSVCAIPGREAHQVLVHTAHGDKIFFWKHGTESHTPGEEQNLVHEGLRNMYEGYFVGEVTAVFPKNGPKVPGLNCTKEKCLSMIYSACEVKANKSFIPENHAYQGVDHMEIRFDLRDYRFDVDPFRFYHSGPFLSPWKDFVGITTDPHYLWVYRAGAIACTTHQDVWDCFNNGLAQPNWMIYEIPHQGISKDSYDPEVPEKDEFTVGFNSYTNTTEEDYWIFTPVRMAP